MLVVEDEAAILRTGKAMLEHLGYTVLSTPGPLEALRIGALHAGEIDLLLTDVVMPEMNGKELAEQLRSIIPGLECLYTSGYTADVIADRGVLHEGVRFIQKPYEMRELARKVYEVLRSKKENGDGK